MKIHFQLKYCAVLSTLLLQGCLATSAVLGKAHEQEDYKTTWIQDTVTALYPDKDKNAGAILKGTHGDYAINADYTLLSRELALPGRQVSSDNGAQNVIFCDAPHNQKNISCDIGGIDPFDYQGLIKENKLYNYNSMRNDWSPEYLYTVSEKNSLSVEQTRYISSKETTISPTPLYVYQHGVKFSGYRLLVPFAFIADIVIMPVVAVILLVDPPHMTG